MEQKNFNRDILKCAFEDDWSEWPTDNTKGVPEPSSQKECGSGKTIDLVDPSSFEFDVKLQDVIKNRRSHREFTSDSLSLEEFSFLLWSTQGVTDDNIDTHRAVPSAGGCHPFETYLVVRRVDGIDPGIYRYLPLEHKIHLVSDDKDGIEKISTSCFEVNTPQMKDGAVIFIWSVVPYRTEWRSGAYAYKFIALDAGHLCQNLYLAVGAIGAGTCAIAAYDQDMVDKIICVNGHDEFAIYLATVGKI